MRFPLLQFLTIAVLGLAAPAWAQDAGAIVVEQPWARASIMASRPAAAYFTLVNESNEPATLVALETTIAGRAEVHQTNRQGEVMKMAPAGPVEVPAGESVRLEPGNLHVMLMDMPRPIKEGETFTLTLRFAKAAPVEVSVPVLGPGARGPGNE
jgi:copper(I)-binding protein